MMTSQKAKELWQKWKRENNQMLIERNKKISEHLKGKHHSKETKQKLSLINQGKIIPLETREKIRLSMLGKNKGKVLSEERRKHLSLIKMGKNLSQEHKKKISDALSGIIPWNKGKKMSEETKKKKSETMKKLWKNKELKKHWLKVLAYGRNKRPTSLEKKFIEICQKHNLPYKYVGDGNFWIEEFNPDFIESNGKKNAIEVYARKVKEMRFKDVEEWKQKRLETFKKYGWDVIFFEDLEVNEENVLKRLGR